MSGADFWRTGYGGQFATNVKRIAVALERIATALEKQDEEKK